MNIKRRKRIGLSLLVASTGISMGIGCTTGEKIEEKPRVEDRVTGNLMPPPTIEFCVDVEPKTAEIKVNQSPLIESCTYVYPGANVIVEAEAKGFKKYKEEISVTEKKTHKIELDIDRSSGNTMAPPKKNAPEETPIKKK